METYSALHWMAERIKENGQVIYGGINEDGAILIQKWFLDVHDIVLAFKANHKTLMQIDGQPVEMQSYKFFQI